MENSAAFICHEYNASDAFLCMVEEHNEGAPLLLAKSEKTESRYSYFSAVTHHLQRCSRTVSR